MDTEVNKKDMSDKQDEEKSISQLRSYSHSPSINQQKKQQFLTLYRGKFSLIYRKAEKLASAIYLITNYFSDLEPLRFELRSKAINLLKDVSPLLGTKTTNDPQTHYALRTTVTQLVTLCELGASGNLLSQNNLEILKAEFQKLLQFEGYLPSEPSEVNITLSHEYFKEITPKKVNALSAIRQNPKSFSESGIGASQGIEVSSGERQTRSEVSTLSDTSLKDRKSIRHDIVISIIKKKGSITIKDVLEVIVDCGIKTLQRELQFLVNVGVLKKEGDKRWSRYSLARP